MLLQRIATRLTRWSLRWVSDSWVIAAILTGVTFAVALIFTNSGPHRLIQYSGGGFWALQAFAMQMCLIIMTGYVVSVSAPFRGLLSRLGAAARGDTQPLP